MTQMMSAVLVLAIVGLLSPLSPDRVDAQAITITPANSTIAIGQTQQFTAAGVSSAMTTPTMTTTMTMTSRRTMTEVTGTPAPDSPPITILPKPTGMKGSSR